MRSPKEELAKYISEYIEYEGQSYPDNIFDISGLIEQAIEAFEGGASDSGDRFKVTVTLEEPENVPCVSCGDKSKPLHFNRQCPDCFVE